MAACAVGAAVAGLSTKREARNKALRAQQLHAYGHLKPGGVIFVEPGGSFSGGYDIRPNVIEKKRTPIARDPRPMPTNATLFPEPERTISGWWLVAVFVLGVSL